MWERLGLMGPCLWICTLSFICMWVGSVDVVTWMVVWSIYLDYHNDKVKEMLK